MSIRSGRLPYGAKPAQARTRAQMKKLVYTPVVDDHSDVPAWLDGALRKALDPDPEKRFSDPMELAFALRNPIVGAAPSRLIERDPVRFWKIVSAALAALVLILLFAVSRR